MTAAAANLIIALIPLVNTGADLLIKWVESYRQAAQQTHEWTPEQEASWQATLRVVGPEHQPDQT